MACSSMCCSSGSNKRKRGGCCFYCKFLSEPETRSIDDYSALFCRSLKIDIFLPSWFLLVTLEPFMQGDSSALLAALAAGPLLVKILLGLQAIVIVLFYIDAILMALFMRKVEASIGVKEAGEQLLTAHRRCVVLASVTLMVYIVKDALDMQAMIPLLGKDAPWDVLRQVSMLVFVLIYKGIKIMAVQSFRKWLSLNGGFIPSKEENAADSTTCPSPDLEGGAPRQEAMVANAVVVN